MTARSIENSFTGVLLLGIVLMHGCTEPSQNEPSDAGTGAVDGPLCLGNGGGYVSGNLFGALEMELSWPNEGTECDGMARPGENGARLRFARTFPGSQNRMILIVGIDGLQPERAGNGFAANVTLIDEREGAFYSNSGVPNCWVDIFRQAPLDTPGASRVDGIVYCSGALARQQGQGAVTPREIRFSGRIDWQAVADTEDPALAAGQ